MKVLMINGSPRPKGCTFTALSEIGAEFSRLDVEWEIIQLGAGPLRDCTACYGCRGKNRCVFTDDCINDILDQAQNADGFIFVSPIYYAHPTGRILSALDRIFYSGASVFRHKPGAAVVCARRAGTTAGLDVLEKYFGLAQMPIVSSTYWNMVHGNTPEEVLQDMEGLQTMHNLARNMTWLMRCIRLGEENGVPAPSSERKVATNFIR